MSIPTAQAATATARAALEAFRAALGAELPQPVDCTDEVWEAWNTSYEDAYCDRGGYRLEREVKAAEDALIRLCADHVSTLAASIGASDDVDTVIAVALGERHHRRFYSTRRRVLDLCERLAP